MSTIRVYVETWVYGLKKGLQYPANVYFSIIEAVPSLWFATILWTRLAADRSPLGIYDLGNLLRYYLVTRMLATVISFETDWSLWQDIKNGNLSQYLMRPINCLLFRFLRQMGQDAVKAMSFPVLIGVGYLMVPGALFLPTRFDSLILAAISVINGLILARLLSYLRGAIAFWLHDSGPFAWIDRMAIGVLSGYYLPFGVLPPGLRRVVLVLPFQSLLSTPAEILLGVLDGATALRLVVRNLGWTVVAGIGLSIVWRRGLRRYEALGG